MTERARSLGLLALTQPGVAAHSDDMRIHIRPVRPEDDVALMKLYESLDADDRVSRFASAYHPASGFYRDLTTVEERGGARVVAVLHDEFLAEDQILGEAGYSRLPNGDGELDVTVEKRWRTSLEPYLLDALADCAATSGVLNLEADVPTSDRALVALLRSYGAVVMEHEGWRRVRLLFGTSGRTAAWPGSHDRPRVLVECAGGRWHAEETARSAGFDVLVCPGADADDRPCPLRAGEPCPLAAEADVIVVSGRYGVATRDALLKGHASLHPRTPVFVDPSPSHDRAAR